MTNHPFTVTTAELMRQSAPRTMGPWRWIPSRRVMRHSGQDYHLAFLKSFDDRAIFRQIGHIAGKRWLSDEELGQLVRLVFDHVAGWTY